jgi:hypothetical protein
LNDRGDSIFEHPNTYTVHILYAFSLYFNTLATNLLVQLTPLNINYWKNISQLLRVTPRNCQRIIIGTGTNIWNEIIKLRLPIILAISKQFLDGRVSLNGITQPVMWPSGKYIIYRSVSTFRTSISCHAVN